MPTIDPIAYPIVEVVIPAVLRAALAARTEAYAKNVTVGKNVPNPMPARLVTIRRDGGAAGDLTDNPRLGINVWAATDADADNLARLVVALLPTLTSPQLDLITILSGPTTIADASTTPQRYITAQAATRGVNL